MQNSKLEELKQTDGNDLVCQDLLTDYSPAGERPLDINNKFTTLQAIKENNNTKQGEGAAKEEEKIREEINFTN